MKLCKYASVSLAAVIVCLAFSADVQAESRTWKDATGAFSLEAELVEVSDGKVKLKKESGEILEVAISRLSSGDQQYLKSHQSNSSGASPANISISKLTGKPEELTNDDGKAAGKKSFPRGIASAFEVDSDSHYLTSVKIHAARYGSTRAPKEDFVVTLCDREFKPIADFKFPYSKIERSGAKWVTLRVKPTNLPKDFVICLNFSPTSTKGVFISHDADGKSLVGLPNKMAGSFSGGNWMVRAIVDRVK
jgi:hypothetical protein